jgi:hypothetical protein
MKDTWNDELIPGTIACRERRSLDLASPWKISDRVSEMQLNGEFVNARCRWDTKPDVARHEATSSLYLR